MLIFSPLLSATTILMNMYDLIFPCSVNLVGDRISSSGAILLYHNHVFGKICDGGWDMADATVTCRHLGYPSALAASAAGTVSFEFTDTIVGDVQCTGSETSLFDCPHTETGQYNCSTYDNAAAGVTCEHNGKICFIFLM